MGLHVKWSVLQFTLCGSYCTVGRQCCFRLNGVCFNEHYVEDIGQEVDADVSG